MAIVVRRYHFALVALLPVALSVIGVFTFREEKSVKPAVPEMPPMQEIILEEKKPFSRPEASKAPKKMPPIPAAKKPDGAPPQAAPAVKKIALTFDDGPHIGFTDRLIQVLSDNGVPATFFVVGKQAALHPNLVEKIFQAGHELANHSYTHRDLRTLNEKDLAEELDKTHNLVESITSQKMKFFRPPGGQYNDHVVAEASHLNYTMALWTVLPQDHVQPPSETIVERVMKGAGENGIVLLHSGVENTLTALPEIITALKGQGYRFVTLTDLATGTESPALVKGAR